MASSEVVDVVDEKTGSQFDVVNTAGDTPKRSPHVDAVAETSNPPPKLVGAGGDFLKQTPPGDVGDEISNSPTESADGLGGSSKQAPKAAASKESSYDSAKSATSTLQYEQTPFETFRHQVEDLCISLYPEPKKPSGNDSHRSSTRKIIDTLLSRSRKQLPSPAIPQLPIIERLTGGSFNRIIGITAKIDHSSGPTASATEELILRVPRHKWEVQLDRDTAMLRFIREKTDIPVPVIKAFDTSHDNPLKEPYVLLTRIPGKSLQQVYSKLSHEQNSTIVKEVCKIILKLQAVTNPLPGVVEMKDQNNVDSGFNVRPLDVKSPYDSDWRSKPLDHHNWKPHHHELRYKDTFEFLVTQFGRWRAQELLSNPTGILHWDYQHRFVEAAEQMNDVGIFRDQENCLCHLDLYARNLIVEPKDDGNIDVTGVVDWDSAVFAPKFVSCAPPWWLWADDPDETGSNWDELDESKALEVAKTENGKQLLRLFQHEIGDDFLWYAYEPQYRMARKLMFFAINGLYSNQSVEAADKLLEEWKIFFDKAMSEADAENYPEEHQKDKEDSDGVQQE